MSLTSDSGKIPRALHQLFHVCLWKREINRDNLVATSVTYACITLFKISAFQEVACVYRSSSTCKSGMNSQLMYQHTWQAAYKFLPHLKPFHDFTLPRCRWRIQMDSSQKPRTITQRSQHAHSYMLLSAASLPGSRRQAVHGLTALKHTSATKFKHQGTLENVYKGRHMVSSCSPKNLFHSSY